MYKLIIGEINEKRKDNWQEIDKDMRSILSKELYEKECTIGTLTAAAGAFHDEVQIDWGTFAWKAFKTDIKSFFKKRGIAEEHLEPFDEFKEYGVVYIDN